MEKEEEVNCNYISYNKGYYLVKSINSLFYIPFSLIVVNWHCSDCVLLRVNAVYFRNHFFSFSCISLFAESDAEEHKS